MQFIKYLQPIQKHTSIVYTGTNIYCPISHVVHQILKYNKSDTIINVLKINLLNECYAIVEHLNVSFIKAYALLKNLE